MTQTSPSPAAQSSTPTLQAFEQGRLPFIDGLRGVAILSVLLYHCWVHTIRTPLLFSLGGRHVDVTAPLHLGYLGVHLFLVLSGFCLTFPLARRGPSGMVLDLRRFFRRRALRILPPYYVALGVFSLLPVVERLLRSTLAPPFQLCQP